MKCLHEVSASRCIWCHQMFEAMVDNNIGGMSMLLHEISLIFSSNP